MIANALADEAVALARASADPAVLVQVLNFVLYPLQCAGTARLVNGTVG